MTPILVRAPLALAFILTALAACTGEIEAPEPLAPTPGAEPEPAPEPDPKADPDPEPWLPEPNPEPEPELDPMQPAASGLRTLTPDQYVASVREVLGEASTGLQIPRIGQWSTSVAAAKGGLSPTTVEAYEDAARALAAQVFGDPQRRATFVECEPTGDKDDPCVVDFLARVGRRAYRRPLSADEMQRWCDVAAEVASSLGDPWKSLELVTTGLLQSSHFLYRPELAGLPTGTPGKRQYTSDEMATRLSYFLWNGPPDDALLEAAELDRLTEVETLAAEVERMLDDPRASAGVEAFAADLFHADAIALMEKDATAYPAFDETQRDHYRWQLVLTARDALLNGPFANLFTTRRTWISQALAHLYPEVDPATLSGKLAPVELPEGSPRAGVHTTPGYVGQHAYPGKTSPALRGLFVRKHLLCQEIPPPPPGVDTVLPEAEEGELVTNRELVAKHQEEPTCAGCHKFMDPIGLALEHFDTIGAFRETHNGLPIDASGDLDGVAFEDAAGLGEAIASHPDLLPCMAATLYAYGTGNTASEAQPELLAVAGAGDSARDLMRAVALSEVFRFAFEAEEAADE